MHLHEHFREIIILRDRLPAPAIMSLTHVARARGVANLRLRWNRAEHLSGDLLQGDLAKNERAKNQLNSCLSAISPLGGFDMLVNGLGAQAQRSTDLTVAFSTCHKDQALTLPRRQQ